MREVQITRGLVTLVDDADYEAVAAQAWQPVIIYGRVTGVQRVLYLGGGRDNQVRQTVQLHRVLLGVTDRRTLVDHRDGNPLNNMRSNLRLATRAQNSANLSGLALRKRQQGGFLGVSFCKRTGRWVAQLKVRGVWIWLGRHDTAEAAAHARDAAALEHQGEFAALNFPERKAS